MPYVMVDVEADGPIPGDYSMVSFGAVIVEPQLDRTFYGKLKPISEQFIPEALAVSGFTREETLAFDDPQAVMESFRLWLDDNCKGRMMFISDNNGFDWQSSIGTSTTSLAAIRSVSAPRTLARFIRVFRRILSSTSSTSERQSTRITLSMMRAATRKHCCK
jgi:hypothetical protein